VSSRTGSRGRSEAAIWQEVEFGSYAADLALWAELADAADAPTLELGAGAGRVALHLAERGHQVIALDSDQELLTELQLAAAQQGLAIASVTADLAAPVELELPSEPGLVIGPLHVVQVLEVASRPSLLGRLSELSAPGATLALTLVDESTLLSAGTAATITGGHKNRRRIIPDMRELDGWVYSSEPLWVQVGNETLTVRRLRERVSPDGRMEREIHDEILHRVSPELLEQEAEAAGMRPAGRRQIRSGSDEADSTIVLLEVTP
jgi:SAM-dependent methyltransferase